VIVCQSIESVVRKVKRLGLDGCCGALGMLGGWMEY